MGRPKREGSSGAVPVEDEDNFVRLLLHALGNKSIASKLKEALGVTEQIACLQHDLGTLRTELATRDAKIVVLEKRLDESELKNDELEQYSRRNSLRLTGLAEKSDEDVVGGLLNTFNVVMGITPPIEVAEIDRVHRVGKPDTQRGRAILVKFATYRSKRRVLEMRRALNPANRTEMRATLADFIGPRTEAETRAEQQRTGENAARLFLNDDLTRKRQQLLYECRQAKKKTLINDCWSYDGTILIKTLTNKVMPVTCVADIANGSMATIH